MELFVDDGRTPGMRAWTAEGRRLLLTQHRRPLVASRISITRERTAWARVGEAERIVAPIGAQQARGTSPTGWLQFFVGALRASPDGPLHDGHWRLEESVRRITTDPAATGTRLHTAEAGFLAEKMSLLPLRAVPPAGAGRVKAYRRMAREGILPPALVWEVTGLVGHVVLDGTCRLAAAVAEEVAIGVVVLRRRDPELEQRVDAWEAERYATGMARTGDPDAAGRCLGPELARSFATPTAGRTLARALPGGVDAWWQAGGMVVPVEPELPRY